nr:hypothetical protein BaRGS_012520 [Batillaria attramentaria]
MSYCRMAVQDKPYWIGADDRRTGQWMWADNSDIRFSAFAWGQPNSSFGHCLVVAASGKWRANDCATLRRFVCEKPAEPELVVDDNLAFSTTPPPSTDDDMVYWSTTPRPSTDDDMVYWSTTPRPSTDDADDIAETMLRFSLEALRRELRELLEELGQVTSKIDDVQQADIGNVFWQRPMA